MDHGDGRGLDAGPLFHLLDVGICIHDAETGLVVDVNPYLCERSGLTREQFLALPPSIFVRSDPWCTLEGAIERVRAAARGEVQRFEWHSAAPDGSDAWMSVTLRAGRLGGKPVVIALVRDITAERRAATALYESDARHRAVLSSLDALIYICSPDLRVEYMNQTLIDRTGRDGTGEQCYRVLHNLEAPCPWCVNERVFAGETVRWETRSPKDDRWYYTVNTPIRHQDSSLSKLAVIQDVTEQKLAERELQRVERLEALSLLAGGIAHDFNNLLTGILGNLELASTASPPVLADEYLRLAAGGCVNARALTEKLLAFSREETVDRRPVGMAELLDTLCRLVFAGRPHSWRLDVPRELPPLAADPSQIHQVFQNLLVNALQATPEGGHIEIEARLADLASPPRPGMVAGPTLVFTVADDGPGIPEAVHERIFEPFFTTKEGGTGLGLAIVYGIVRRHGGHIEITSAPKAGTVFTLYFPLGQTARTPEPNRASPRDIDLQGMKVLVMDDSDSVLYVARKMLARMGCDVEVALNGEVALALFEQALRDGKPHGLVLSDLTVVNGMGGSELVRRIRGLDPATRILMSTGYSEESTGGRTPMLRKPYTFDELRDAVCAVLQQPD